MEENHWEICKEMVGVKIALVVKYLTFKKFWGFVP